MIGLSLYDSFSLAAVDAGSCHKLMSVVNRCSPKLKGHLKKKKLACTLRDHFNACGLQNQNSSKRSQIARLYRNFNEIYVKVQCFVESSVSSGFTWNSSVLDKWDVIHVKLLNFEMCQMFREFPFWHVIFCCRIYFILTRFSCDWCIYASAPGP